MNDISPVAREEPRDENPALSLALGAASREKADTLLGEQTRLVRLQALELEHELSLRHWSLRVHHVSDLMKVSFEVAVALIMAGVIVLLASTIWTAAHDNSLVIEAFTVPPDMAARGLTGQAVAAQIEDRLASLQDATGSARPANSYAHNWGDDIKVQIPDTGVSIGEFYRLLASWLGHQTHINGEVWRNGGAISITARAEADGAAVVTGKEADFPMLLQHAAEAIYSRTQPYRYAAYLEFKGLKNADPSALVRAKAIMQRLSVEGATVRERAWAWVGLGVDSLFSADIPGSAADFRQAIALIPDFALAFSDLDSAEVEQEHEEASLAAARASARLLEDSVVDMTPRARAITLPWERANAAGYVGDFREAVDEAEAASRLPDYSGEVEIARESIALYLALQHDARFAREAWYSMPAAPGATSRDTRLMNLLILDADLGDWSRSLSIRADAAAALQRTMFRHQAAQMLSPSVALAMARSGDMTGAEALIAKTPLDCDLCLRTRGNIAALKHDWTGAARWFAMLSKRTPSIPFADTDWGRMLLQKGDYDGAIAKFRGANLKGPHFADPLEMWGEALIEKNRSDLAIAKFEEANKYAPGWGRLHLEWGKALYYAGNKDEAQKQFALARQLDLSAADRSVLSGWMKRHG